MLYVCQAFGLLCGCWCICNIVIRDCPFVMFWGVMLRYDVMEKRVNVTKDVTLENGLTMRVCDVLLYVML